MISAKFIICVVACVILQEALSYPDELQRDSPRRFPDGFLFGSATSAYQIEGAWNTDGKSESIWDHLVHTRPEVVKDNSTGDIANDSYHLYKRDVEMLRELGVDFYRFSLAWTRILPTGFPDKINEAGVNYYNNLIDELLKYNIQPMVTLYHWDIPQKLQELGGWINPHVVDWFADYAQVAFELFGDRVKYWITINEPDVVCHYGYGIEHMAPRLNIQGFPEYLCAKNILMAHAKVYHMYDEKFRPSQNGTASISFSMQWYEPASEEYTLATEETFQFTAGLYAHPIYTQDGGWPSLFKDKIAARSAEQGFPRSRLPDFTAEEADLLRGSSDFFGLNHYTTYYVYRNDSVNDYEIPSRDDDLNTITYQLSEWEYAENDYINTVPWGFFKLLNRIKEEYNNPPVIVTENGFAMTQGLEDEGRIQYMQGYLAALLDAVDAGVDIRAYTMWSLMDNYEWVEGYTECFGLYEVDYSSPERTRTPRKSAFVYKEIVRTHVLDDTYDPDTTTMTIDEGH